MHHSLVNWPPTHYGHHHHRESEEEAAKREREEGKRHPYRPPSPVIEWGGGVPGGTGSPDYPGKHYVA